MRAARSGRTTAVDVLLRHKARHDVRDRAGGTALLYGLDTTDAQQCHIILDLLVGAGADVNLLSNRGEA
jgi:hypothetical protein